MKSENIFYISGTVIVLLGVLMKVLHMSGGNVVLLTGIIGGSLYKSWLISKLKNRIKELEE
ncbi:MAG: hypothetical protein V4651_13260 [Bacteroidota bacterium]